MTQELFQIVALLALGYLLLLMEIFVPGGILGILGFAAIAYGCWLAFALGTLQGAAAVGSSFVVAAAVVVMVVRSKAARKLVLDTRPSRDWKAPDPQLVSLVGRLGVTVSPLRPAGIAEVDERRLDVVTDSEYLEAGVSVRVSDVEGARIVVQAVSEGSDQTED